MSDLAEKLKPYTMRHPLRGAGCSQSSYSDAAVEWAASLVPWEPERPSLQMWRRPRTRWQAQGTVVDGTLYWRDSQGVRHSGPFWEQQ